MKPRQEAIGLSSTSQWFLTDVPVISHRETIETMARFQWNVSEIPLRCSPRSIGTLRAFPGFSPSECARRSEWIRHLLGKRLITKIPSLSPVTPLKSFAVKHLRHGRDVRCPSRIPPVLGPFTNLVRGLNYSIRQIRFLKTIGGFEVEKGRETGVIFNVSPVASALCISMFQLCDGSKGG